MFRITQLPPNLFLVSIYAGILSRGWSRVLIWVLDFESWLNLSLWSCLTFIILLPWWLPQDCWHPRGFIFLLHYTCISKHLVYLRCKMYYLFDLHTASIARLSERDLSSFALPEVSPIFPFKLWGFSLEVFPCTMWGSKDRGRRIVILIFCINCEVHWDKCNICDIGQNK